MRRPHHKHVYTACRNVSVRSGMWRALESAQKSEIRYAGHRTGTVMVTMIIHWQNTNTDSGFYHR